MGGAGSAVLEALAAAQIKVPVLTLGLPDAFIQHGDPAKLLAMCGLDAAGIEASIRTRFGLTLESDASRRQSLRRDERGRRSRRTRIRRIPVILRPA